MPSARTLTPFCLTLFASIVGCSGAPAPTVVVPITPKVAEAPKPTVVHWSFLPAAFRHPRGVFSTGNPDEVLLLGQHGERAILKGDVLTSAGTLAPEALVGVLKEGDTFVFVGASGATYTGKDLLAEVVHKHKPKHAFRHVHVGKQSILGVLGGQLYRSKDFGATYEVTDVAHMPTTGAVAHVVASNKGEVLLELTPQAYAVSVDDGATFTLLRQGTGLWEKPYDTVVGVDDFGIYLHPEDGKETLRLTADGTKWAAGKAISPVVGKINHELGADPITEVDDEGHYLARRGTQLFYATIGGTLSPLGLDKACEFRGDLARVRGTVVEVACLGAGKSAHSVTLQRSTDSGKTFTPDGNLHLARARDAEIWLGPDGAMFFKGACVTDKEDCHYSGTLRGPGEKGFHELPMSLYRLSVYDLAFLKDKIVMVGSIGSATGRGVEMISTKDSGKTFERIVLSPPDSKDESEDRMIYTRRFGAIGHDEHAVYSVAMAYRSGLEIFHFDGGKPVMGKLPKGTLRLDLTGVHGLASVGRRLMQTSDAGKSWHYAGRMEGGWMTCGAMGCVFPKAERIGWDLPEHHRVEHEHLGEGGHHTRDWSCKTADKMPAATGVVFSNPLFDAMYLAPDSTHLSGYHDGKVAETLPFGPVAGKDKPVVRILFGGVGRFGVDLSYIPQGHKGKALTTKLLKGDAAINIDGDAVFVTRGKDFMYLPAKGRALKFPVPVGTHPIFGHLETPKTAVVALMDESNNKLGSFVLSSDKPAPEFSGVRLPCGIESAGLLDGKPYALCGHEDVGYLLDVEKNVVHSLPLVDLHNAAACAKGAKGLSLAVDTHGSPLHVDGKTLQLTHTRVLVSKDRSVCRLADEYGWSDAAVVVTPSGKGYHASGGTTLTCEPGKPTK